MFYGKRVVASILYISIIKVSSFKEESLGERLEVYINVPLNNDLHLKELI